MNKPQIFKKLSVRKKLAASVVAVGTGIVLVSNLVGGASAIPYQGDQTQASPVPAFNVYTGDIPAPAPAGGENDFFRGRVPVNGNTNDSTTQFGDPVATDCTNGKIVQMQVYVHNGASANANNNGSGPSVAHGTKVKVSLPGDTADPATATISADNASQVMDNLKINCNGQQVKLKYISGSASQYSEGSGVVPLSDAIVSSGVPIRSHQVAGDVWGCWEERVFVVLSVQLEVAPPPPPPAPVFTCDLFSIATDVNRTAKVTNFATTAKNGATFKNVVIDWGDGAPALTTVSPVGQTHQYAADNSTYTIKATAHFTVNGQDMAATSTACQQQVKFQPSPPPEQPVYSCDLFEVKPGTTGRTTQVTTLNTTAKNGATFKNAVIDWGDNTTPLTTNNAVGQTHEYAADGTYTIKATAHFTVNGQDVTATSEKCQQQVKFLPPPPEKPVYSCDLFEIKAATDHMVKVTSFAVTAKNGATFKNATLNWGDNTPVTIVSSSGAVVGQSHQYTTDDTFMVTATATFVVDGKEVTAGGPACQKQVTFTPNKPPETPVYSCDLFAIKATSNRTITATVFNTTAKDGATFANAVIDWGDTTTPLTTNTVVGQTHQYAKDGTYIVTVTPHFTVNGKDVVASSVKCQQQVTFAPNVPPVITPPPTTPAPPATLVNTGAGENLAALFAAVTAIGMIVYRRLLTRGLNG